MPEDAIIPPHLPRQPKVGPRRMSRAVKERLQNGRETGSPAANLAAGGGIIIRGAHEHNLKHIDLVLPRNRLIVITGLSGSGKSSLAFDTLYAEGQRRYVESLSAYARQFLERLEKPSVEAIEGLSPAVSIDQKGASHNPRSTVGTVTEIYDYFRLLFARVGVPHCPICGKEVVSQSAQEVVEAVEKLPEDSRLLLLAPIVRHRKGTHQAVLDEIAKSGFVRARVDGELVDLDVGDLIVLYMLTQIAETATRRLKGINTSPRTEHAAHGKRIQPNVRSHV